MSCEGEHEVKAVPQDKLKLNREKLRGKIETLKTNKEGTILLNKKNEQHRDWYEDK